MEESNAAPPGSNREGSFAISVVLQLDYGWQNNRGGTAWGLGFPEFTTLFCTQLRRPTNECNPSNFLFKFKCHVVVKGVQGFTGKSATTLHTAINPLAYRFGLSRIV